MDGEPFERYPEFEEIHTNRRQYVTVNRQQPSAPEMDDDSSPRPPSYSPDVPTPPPEYPLAIPAHLTAPIATSPQKRRKVVDPVVLSIHGTPAARYLDVAARFIKPCCWDVDRKVSQVYCMPQVTRNEDGCFEITVSYLLHKQCHILTQG